MNDRNAFITENHGLIYKFLGDRKLDQEEYYGLAAIGLCLAADTYDDSLGFEFSTYAFRCMANEVFKEKQLSKTKRKGMSVKPESLDTKYVANEDDVETSFKESIPDSTCVENEVVAKVTFEKFIDCLNDKEQKVAKLLASGKTQRMVAGILGMSQQNANRIVSDIRRKYSTAKEYNRVTQALRKCC